MNKYRGTRLLRSGLIGLVSVVLVIAVGLSPESVVSWATTKRYQASFLEAGGLAVGNDVKVSGVKVGSVSEVALEDGEVQVTFAVNSSLRLGIQTTAHIRTGSILGERIMTLEPSGTGSMRSLDRIPSSRTASPYSLSEAAGDLTVNSAGTDTEALNQSLDTLSEMIDQIAPTLGPTFEGLTRVSRSLNSRNEILGELLQNAASITDILSKRSRQVNELILNGNDLVAVLNDRRHQIVQILNDTSALAIQIAGLIDDNEHELAPTLQKLNAVTQMLEQRRDDIAKALPGLARFQNTLSETVASGPYYIGFIPNISAPVFLQPFLDYAFGFRRGVNAGRPPDTAGPRAEFPFPRNGIPQRPN